MGGFAGNEAETRSVSGHASRIKDALCFVVGYLTCESIVKKNAKFFTMDFFDL